FKSASVIASRRRRSAPLPGGLPATILRSMSSDMRRIRRWARLSAVPPPNTSCSGPASIAAIAASALTTWKSFSTSAGLGNPKCACTSSSSRRRSSLKHELRISIAELTREPSLHPHCRVDRHLRRAPIVVGALGFSRFPFYAKLVERLARRTGKAIRAIKDRFTGQLRDGSASVNAVAQPHKNTVAHHGAQRAQHLVFTAEVRE